MLSPHYFEWRGDIVTRGQLGPPRPTACETSWSRVLSLIGSEAERSKLRQCWLRDPIAGDRVSQHNNYVFYDWK